MISQEKVLSYFTRHNPKNSSSKENYERLLFFLKEYLIVPKLLEPKIKDAFVFF
jgi:hypothetical protein